MTSVLADSFYYIALLNPRDRFHEAAVQATRDLSNPLVTTSAVLTEVADALSSPAIRTHVHRFLGDLDADRTTSTIEVDRKLFEQGLFLYGSRPDKSWSLTDCISFEVMTTRGIQDALTADHHFEPAGFRCLMRRPELA